MKFAILAPLLAAVSAGRFVASPVEKVVKMITELKATVEADGKEELVAYDKYACWCEDTLATKAADIAKAKTDIENMRKEYIKLGGELASLEVDIKQIKKDLAENLESQKEAKSMRDKELEAYMEDRTEAENCIGALEAAIKILTNAGTKSTGFLATLEEAQVLSTVGSLRGVLGTRTIRQKVAQKDLDIVRQFIESPDDFLKAKSGMVALQEPKEIKKAPAGYNQDYAPQSGQIQGVLKQMYDDFTGKLEGANVEESKKRKAYEELMEVKVKEQKALEGTLQSSETAQAEKTSEHADTKSMLDLTQEQLEADEEFFAQTKDSCKKKAQSWAQRTRLRAEELQGMTTAIRILSSDDAQKTFENATTTFLQVASSNGGRKAKVVAEFKKLLKKYNSVSLAKIAAQVQSGGHFDSVIESIDKMISFLRKEEQADIEHRDRCQGAQNKNANDMADLDHEITKSGKEIERLQGESKALQTKIDATQADIDATIQDMETLLQMRNEAHAVFVQALKDDDDAVELLDMAIVALTKFYKKNRIPLSLLGKADPSYTVDPDKAPETVWDGGDYGGRTSETGGIVAIIGMLKEDLQKEMKTAREEEAADQEAYVQDRAAMNEVISAHKASKLAFEKSKADTDAKITDTEEYKGQKMGDHDSEIELNTALYADCSWVDTHFETRRNKRKTEMDGLNEAKDYLAGVE